MIGAAANGNPGTPTNPLSPSQVSSTDFQFNYLQGLAGQNFDIFRDYHCTYGAAACTAQGSSLTNTDIKYAQAGDDININWLPSPDWTIYPVSAADTDPTKKAVYDEIVAAAGSYNSIAPTPIYLTVWHEMNLHVSSQYSTPSCNVGSQAGVGSPQQFIAAWRNIHDIFAQQGVTNVKWTMNYASDPARNCLVPLMWPGDGYVDWVTYDTYSRGKTWDAGSGGGFYNFLLANTNTTTNPVQNVNGLPVDFTSKPWGVGEFGTCKQPATGIAEPDYFMSMQTAYLAGTYPRLHMYVIYANPAGDSGYGCLTDYDTDQSNPGGLSGTYDACKQQAVNDLLATIEGNTGATTSCPGTPSPTPSPTPPTTSPSPSCQPIVGDINHDCHVDALDLSALINAWGTSNVAADLNNNGNVGLFDLSILLSHWTG